MNLKLKMYFVLFSVLLFSVCSCVTQKKTEGFNKENGNYYNSKVGFEIDIPKTWYVLSDKQIDNMLTTMWNKMIEDSLISKEEVEDAATFAFLGFQTRPNIDIEENPYIGIIINNEEKIPNIQIVFESIEKFPNLKTESDYIAHAELGRSPSKLNPDYISKKVFSEREFYYLNILKEEDKNIATNKRYTTLVGKFALSITVSYFNEKQKKEVEEILETMKFEK
ncbi:hypothetical protein WAF17_18155 [Bernardetia sp. ABR2-2B]|uniref:hypothetical protein n=1 Tax=Bernardetia sp. ABR2-2B TaxID=3127472 RepID=UPI0030D37507